MLKFCACFSNVLQTWSKYFIMQRALSDSVCHRVGFWTAHFCKKKYVEKWVEMGSQCQHRVFERILFCPFITFSTPSIYCFFEILPQYSPTFRYALTISRKPFAVHFVFRNFYTSSRQRLRLRFSMNTKQIYLIKQF